MFTFLVSFVIGIFTILGLTICVALMARAAAVVFFAGLYVLLSLFGLFLSAACSVSNHRVGRRKPYER